MASFSSTTFLTSTTLTHQGRYDVFLSFRGEDTRDNFVSHLYDALTRKQILTFIDNNELRRGEEISPSLFKAIQGSKISVIIFSENYASSKWCLEELTMILDCKKVNGQTVIPVFYRVDPSTVRNQSGSFADAFAKHEMVLKEKVRNWKEGLKEAGNLAGWDSFVTRPESKLINEIVEDILKKLDRMSLSTLPEGLVGIASRIEKVESLLCMESVEVRSVGLWGMGGIGKTTIAKAVCHHIYTQFEGFQFLENIMGEIKRDGVDLLWNKLLSKLFGKQDLDMGIFSLGLTFREERLHGKKVLVVFDDVDDSILIKMKDLLDRRHNLFGQGSKILITSRDKQVLKNLVDEVYEVTGLNHNEAIELFSLNAFKEKYPTIDNHIIHIEQMERVVNYANGNPLALKILGCALFKRSKDDWDSALGELGKLPKPEILSVLRISYDRLSWGEKNIFLDIAYFFRGEDKDCAIEILSINHCVGFIISNLINKSLITVSHKKKLEMHDLVQEMAKSIVHEESTNPGKRSRLSDPKDIYDVLTRKKGTEVVEGICLDLSKSKKMHLDSDAFKRMNCLRFLKFYSNSYNYYKSFEEKVHLPHGGLQYLSNELRYLHWIAFSSKSLSPNFYGENLVELILPQSKVKQLWSGVRNLVNLKRIDLSGSKYLTEIPSLSEAKKIERINLWGCESLVELPSFVQYLNRLEYLNVRFCKNLRSLPRRIDSKHLKYLHLRGCPHVKMCPRISSENVEYMDLMGTANKELPKSVHKFKALRILALSGSNITEFPKLSSVHLEYIDLMGTAIEEVPPSIEMLTKLELLDICSDKKLSRLPTSICKLKSLVTLRLDDCPQLKLESFPEILEPMKSLKFLTLSNCENVDFNSEFFRLLSSMTTSLVFLNLSRNNFESLPENIVQLGELTTLVLSNCKRLLSLPKLPKSLRCLEIENCLKLDQKARTKITSLSSPQIILPGSEIPEWVSYQSMGSSLTILLHQSELKQEVVGVTFCIVFALRKPSRSCLYVPWRFRFIDNNGERCSFASSVKIGLLTSDQVLWWHPRGSHLLDLIANNNKGSFEFDLGHDIKVKKCGVHLHYCHKRDFFGGSMRDDANNKLKRDHDDFSSNDVRPSNGKSDNNPNKRIKLLQA